LFEIIVIAGQVKQILIQMLKSHVMARIMYNETATHIFMIHLVHYQN